MIGRDRFEALHPLSIVRCLLAAEHELALSRHEQRTPLPRLAVFAK